MLGFLRLLLIIGTLIATDLVWWRVADRAVRRWRGAIAWRVGVGAFALAMLLYAVLWALGTFTEHVPDVPIGWAVTTYMWQLGPGLWVLLLLGGSWVVRKVRRRRVSNAPKPQ